MRPYEPKREGGVSYMEPGIVAGTSILGWRWDASVKLDVLYMQFWGQNTPIFG